jgi:hypothetical protein
MKPESGEDLVELREVLQVGVILQNIELHLSLRVRQMTICYKVVLDELFNDGQFTEHLAA